jgi:hypothetical protein
VEHEEPLQALAALHRALDLLHRLVDLRRYPET